MPINANVNLSNVDVSKPVTESGKVTVFFNSLFGVKSSTHTPAEWQKTGKKLFVMSSAHHESAPENGVLAPKQVIANVGLALINGAGAAARIFPQVSAQWSVPGMADVQNATSDMPASISEAVVPSFTPHQIQKRAVEGDAPELAHVSPLTHINQGVEALLRGQRLIGSAGKIPLPQLLTSAIAFCTRNEQSKLALVRTIQRAKGHYGELPNEALSDAHQDSIIKHWVTHNVFGQSIGRFLEHKVIEHGDDPEAKSPLRSLDIQNHLTNRLSRLFKPYAAEASTYHWIWSNVVLRELPILRFKDVHHESLTVQDVEWGQKNAGLMFAQSIGHDLNTLSAESAWMHGNMLLAQLKEGMVPLAIFFRLPSMLRYAHTHSAVMRVRGDRLATDVEVHAMNSYFAAHDRHLAQENLVSRFENAVGNYRTRGQLAQEVIDDRCPGMEVSTYLNLVETFCRITPHGRPYEKPEHLENINVKFQKKIDDTVAAFSDLNKPLLLAGWNQLGDEELEFIKSAQVRRVAAEFSAADALNFQVMGANAAARASLTFGLTKEVELFSAHRRGEPERIYAQLRNNRTYKVYRIDREESHYRALLEKELPAIRTQDIKLKSFAVGDPLKEHDAELEPLLDRIAEQHQRTYGKYLYDYGYDKTTLEKVKELGLSLIPFYTCISSVNAGKQQEAALACSIDALTLIPVIGTLASASGAISKVIGTGLLRAKLVAANEIALGYSIRQVIKSSTAEFMRITYPELIQVAQGGMRSVALASLRRVDPGLEVGYMLGKKSTSTVLALGSRMIEKWSPAMKAEWSKLAFSAGKLPNNIVSEVRYAHLAGIAEEVPVIKLVPLVSNARRKTQDVFVKMNLATGEPAGQKYIMKDNQLFPVRIKNILNQGLSGRGAPQKGQQWAQEDRAAARSAGNALQQPVGAMASDVNAGAGPSGASVVTSQTMSRAQLLQVWETWKNAAPLSDRNLRRDVVEQMMASLDGGNHKLVLGDCSDSNFPSHLPPSVTELVLSGTQLTRLPDNLPPDLTVLIVSKSPLTKLPDNLPLGLSQLTLLDTKLTALPDNLPLSLTRMIVLNSPLAALPERLPERLQQLFVVGGGLTTLPESLPQSLVHLDVYRNQLSKLPENLPQGLVTLNAHDNCLHRLPENWPSGLTQLVLDENQLSVLPENLPPGLIELSVGQNQLTTLPKILPPNIKRVRAAGNQLNVLPRKFPQSLTLLDVSNNKLTHLREALFELPRGAVFTLDGNPLSMRAQQALRDLPDDFSTYGPRVIFPLSSVEPWPSDDFLATYTGSTLREKELVNTWGRWENTRPIQNHEMRDIAVIKMKRCLFIKSRLLDLSDLRLSTLPESLDSNLSYLNLDGNRLMASTTALPERLQGLSWGRNYLTELPQSLPQSLKRLTVSGNQLTELHNNLPQELIYLDVSTNDLVALPENLPQSLSYLNVNGNDLVALPENLPQNLCFLAAVQNQLTTLPENLRARSPLTIDVENNHFSERTLASWQQAMNNRAYQGARIFFSMQSNAAHSPVRLLNVAVASWLEPDHATRVAAEWAGIAQGEGSAAGEFGRFLDRLADTASARGESGFKQQVVLWLNRLTESSTLREQTFAAAYEATTTCEDRVICTFNKMQQVLVTHDVDIQRYDNDLEKLVSVGREMFRLEQLEQIAHEKVAALNFVDEIEVHLAYQVKLRESLRLTTVAEEMRFYDVSSVTSEDLSQAESAVKRLENEDFPAWLSQWEPWQGALKRIDQTAYSKAIEALNESVGGTYFKEKLREVLQKENLPEDLDVEAPIGKKVMDEITRDIYMKLTNEVLSKKQLSNLLDPQWETEIAGGSGVASASSSRQR